MPDDEKLPIPLEIPWRLAATTQKLKSSTEPDDVTISLFHYEPQLDTLSRDYPNDRVIYLKFTVSISPRRRNGPFGILGQYVPRNIMEGGLPVWHVLLDLRVMPQPFATGGIRPYFHAAAPIRREMIETGIVGNDLFEGASSGVSVGKSASQLHETVDSKIRKVSESSGLFPSSTLGGFGTSVQGQSTFVDSERQVDQTVETTMREASQERRELLSHLTNVQNMLTLLNARHVGSPYLRFAMWPRPLRLLSMDAADPNLWYSQLLHRRSSGIEGIQEFITVVLVPKNRDFCIEARLRRFWVIDNPPEEPVLPPYYEYAFTDPWDRQAVHDYLYSVYPRGTPLEELDVDVMGQIDLTKFPRPVLYAWGTSLASFGKTGVVSITFVSPALDSKGRAVVAPDLPEATWIEKNVVWYKEFAEVFREMQEAAYEETLARSPLERGEVFMDKTELKTCFKVSETDIEVAGPPTYHTGTTNMIGFEPGGKASGKVKPHPSSGGKYRVHALRWNDLDRQLASYVAQVAEWRDEPVRLDSPRLVILLLDAWAGLAPEDPKNIPLSTAANVFGFNATQRRLLQKAGIADLRGIVRAIRSASIIERHNDDLRSIREQLDEKQRCFFSRQPIPAPLSARDAEGLRKAIVATLARASR
jgi:hypothetical protein